MQVESGCHLIGRQLAQERLFAILQLLKQYNGSMTTADVTTMLEWPHSRTWDYLSKAADHRLVTMQKIVNDTLWTISYIASKV